MKTFAHADPSDGVSGNLGGPSAGDHSAGLFLADVLARLEASPSRERRHVEMKSAIRKMGDVLRRPLSDIPADPAKMRVLIAAASRASVGMTKARWSRIRSLTLAALRDLGIDTMPGRDVSPRSPAWSELSAALPTRALQHGLSRVMSYCSREGIEPSAVTAATFEAFYAALMTRSLKEKPEALYRGTVRLWNKAVDCVPGWPQVRIPLETHPHYYSFPWESFPASFVADVEAFLCNSVNGNELDELDDGFVRPVRPGTVVQRRRQLRQLTTLLVMGGFPIDQVTSLGVLTEPENARAALRFQRARQGSKITVSLGQMAWLLCTIARYWLKDRDQADALRKIARGIDPKGKGKPKGMNPRNRDRLRQFDLKANVLALLRLPDDILRRARRDNTGTAEEARLVMLGFAVELELVAPMRVGNLTALEHQRHIVEFGRGRSRMRHVIIPAEETKNGRPFEMALPECTMQLMDAYMKTYRSRICPVSSPYLFPNPTGDRRGPISFSRAITDLVERELGIKMHAHLFRHLAGKLLLDRDPTDMETPRQVLGHENMGTTAQYYLEQRVSQAFERLDHTIADLRGPPAHVARHPHATNPRSPRT